MVEKILKPTYFLSLQVKVWFQNRRTKLKRNVTDGDDNKDSSASNGSGQQRAGTPESFVESDFEDDEDDLDTNIDVV